MLASLCMVERSSSYDSDSAPKYSQRHDLRQVNHYGERAVAELRAQARLLLLPLRLNGRQERPWLLHPRAGDTIVLG